jgi:hypothetical protein
MKPYTGPPMTLGDAAEAHVRLLVWCRDCGLPGRARPGGAGQALRCRDDGSGLGQASHLLALRLAAGRLRRNRRTAVAHLV